YICFRAQHRHVSDPISRRAGSDRPAARSNRIDHSRLQIVAFIVSATFACKLVNAARARWEELRLSTHDPELVAAAIRTRREGVLWVWEAPAAELIDAHQRQHLAQREPVVSGPLGAAQQEERHRRGAPPRGRALAARKRAAGSAARGLRTRASERPAVGQRLGRSSGRGWPPVREDCWSGPSHDDWRKTCLMESWNPAEKLGISHGR